MKPSQATSFPVPCAAWVNRLAAHHPDDLARDERAALQQHLDGCPACAAVHAAYQQIDAGILSLPVVQLSAQQIAQLEASITNEIAHEPEEEITAMPHQHLMLPERVPTRPVRTRIAAQVNAVAAVLVVMLLIASAFALFSRRPGPSPTSPTGNSPLTIVSPTDAASPANSTVYTVSSAGTVYAVDPGSGKIMWTTPLQMTPDEQFLVSDGTIFLTSSCVRSTCDLYALRAGDGHVLWQRSYHSLLGNAGAASLAPYLASDGKAVYIASAIGIYAWRASDGQQLWQHAPPSACLANSSACQIDMGTATNGLVYVFFDGLYALNATDGSTRWSNVQVPDVGGNAHPIVVTHNHIYVPDYGGSQTVHVLDANTGKLLDTPGLPPVSAADIITDGRVVYVSTTRTSGGGADIYALRSSDNGLLWHRHDTNVLTLYIASTGSLYYGYASVAYVSVKRSATPATARFQVCARRTTDGSLQWCQSLPSDTLPSAAASQGIMYVPGARLGLDAIRLSDGKILWHILAHVSLDDADTVLV